MPKYQRFEDLPAWQEAARLYNHVLDLLEKPRVPLSPACRSQLDRAALSVSTRIAEEFDRGGTGERLSFLTAAHAAADEVMSIIAVLLTRPGLAPFADELQRIRSIAESCARQISGWIYTVKNPANLDRRPAIAPTPTLREAQSKAPDTRQPSARPAKPSATAVQPQQAG